VNVLCIRLWNFRSYERLDLPLPDGATAIVGPNGAGKSSLLTAIDIAFFGARSLEPYLRRGADDLTIEVEFEHGGEAYRVRRGLHGGRSFFDFDRECDAHGVRATPDDRSWEPLTRESQKATQERLEATLGLTRATWRASAYLAQGDAAALTSARPAERMEILRNTIGGLDVYERAHERAKELRRGMEHTIAEYSGAAGLLEGEVAGIPVAVEREAVLAEQHERLLDALTLAEGKRDEASHALAEAQAQQQELRVLDAERGRAEEKLVALERAADVAREAKSRLAIERRRVPALEHAVAPLPRLEAEVEQRRGEQQMFEHRCHVHASAVRAREEAERQHSDLLALAADQRALAERTRAEALEDAAVGPGTVRCRECKQMLGMEALAESVKARQEAAADLDEIASGLADRALCVAFPEVPAQPPRPDEGALDVAVRALADARTALNGLIETRAHIEQLEKVEPPDEDDLNEARIDAVMAKRAYREAADAVEALDFEALRTAASRAGAYLREQQERTAANDRNLAAAQHEVARLHEEERRLRATLDALDAATADQHLLSVVAEMFAPTGIPLLIIENAIPLIETRAQEVLERLGSETASCRVELRTQRALKTSEQLRDTLDIVIHTPDGGELAYEMWSGGERMRLDLAVRIGLAQLLLTHGAHCEVFAVDEPDGLDVQGRAALVEVVEEMRDRYGFSKVLLISHDDALRESFAQTITVERGADGASAVVGAAVEVPA